MCVHAAASNRISARGCQTRTAHFLTRCQSFLYDTIFMLPAKNVLEELQLTTIDYPQTSCCQRLDFFLLSANSFSCCSSHPRRFFSSTDTLFDTSLAMAAEPQM